MTLEKIFYYITNAHTLFPWYFALLIYLGIFIVSILLVLLLRLIILGYEIRDEKKHYKSSVLCKLNNIDNNTDYLENINDNLEDIVYKIDCLIKEKISND